MTDAMTTAEKLREIADEIDRLRTDRHSVDVPDCVEKLRTLVSQLEVGGDVEGLCRLLRALSADLEEMDEQDAAGTCNEAANTIEAQAAEIASLKARVAELEKEVAFNAKVASDLAAQGEPVNWDALTESKP